MFEFLGGTSEVRVPGISAPRKIIKWQKKGWNGGKNNKMFGENCKMARKIKWWERVIKIAGKMTKMAGKVIIHGGKIVRGRER